MDWSEARAAIRDRSLIAEDDVLQKLREHLDDPKPKKARKRIEDAVEISTQMLAMLDEWEKTAEDDGDGDEHDPAIEKPKESTG